MSEPQTRGGDTNHYISMDPARSYPPPPAGSGGLSGRGSQGQRVRGQEQRRPLGCTRRWAAGAGSIGVPPGALWVTHLSEGCRVGPQHPQDQRGGGKTLRPVWGHLQEWRRVLGLPGGEPGPWSSGLGIVLHTPPPPNLLPAQGAHGIPPGEYGDAHPQLAGLCSEHFYGLLIVMLPFNSGCHSMSAKPDKLGFMPPNYGARAVQR